LELTGAVGALKNTRIKVYVVLAAISIPFSMFSRNAVFLGADGGVLGDYLLDIMPFEFWLWMNHLVFTSYLANTSLIVLLIVIFIEAVIAYRTERQISFSLISIILFAVILMPMMLSTLIELRSTTIFTVPPLATIFSWESRANVGRYLVLIPVICAFLTDAGAYLSGRFFGKRKAFPKISPNKTVAGYVGGLITGSVMLVLYGIVINHFTHYNANIFSLALIGIIGAAATQLGDLAFSLIKREYGVKDFGKLLPGHGGMLDRFYSLFFTAPVVYFLVVLLPVIY
jgi:phosphatidate cytidylyltransferase